MKHGDEFRSLESEDQVFGIDLDAAVALLRGRRSRAGGRARRARCCATWDRIPQSGAAMKLLEGRYGPYVTDGTTNASLPKGTDPAALPVAEAVALLEARAGIPSKKRPARRAGGARKAAREQRKRPARASGSRSRSKSGAGAGRWGGREVCG